MFGVWKFDKECCEEKMVFFGSLTDCLAYVGNNNEFYITDEPVDGLIMYED